jgi:heavy metal sensor kinase
MRTSFSRLFGLHRVRARLTVWYVCVLASVLILSWILTASFLFLQLRNQLDHYAIQDIETVEGLLYFDSRGVMDLNEEYHNHPESKQVLERLLEVLSPQGTVLYRNERLAGHALGGNILPREGEGGYSARSNRLADGTPVRMVSRAHVLKGRPLLLRLGYSEEPIRARLREFALASLLALPIVMALVGFGSYLLAKRALTPLEEMACQAEAITSERLNERLPISEAGDEMDHLAAVFNNLLARLEQSFEQLRKFTSDASHELRTPLASIRSVGEVALEKDGTRAEYRDTIGSMLEEVNRLTVLVDNLLTIARADSGRIPLNPTVFSAVGLAREAVGLLDVLAEEKNQRITVQGDERIELKGDRVFLRQALVNIIHNAVKHSPMGGAISVVVWSDSVGGVRLEVADSGPGIAAEHSEKVFDRFYRADESRSREGGGAGLGLSIAQWAVRLHGGKVQLVTAPGEGCIFQMSLPPAMPAKSS